MKKTLKEVEANRIRVNDYIVSLDPPGLVLVVRVGMRRDKSGPFIVGWDSAGQRYGMQLNNGDLIWRMIEV